MTNLQTTPGSAHVLPITVEIFDPPMCCPTGLCGPTLDQTLLDMNETVLALKGEGIAVERYQMTTHPQVFLKYPDVMRLVRERGIEVFPITAIAGKIVKVGGYPSLDEVERALEEARA